MDAQPNLSLESTSFELAHEILVLINRGSYMSAHVLLNLLNELVHFIDFLEQVKFNKTGARVLESIYHMTLKLLKNHILRVKTSKDCVIFYSTLHYEICKPLVVYPFYCMALYYSQTFLNLHEQLSSKALSQNVYMCIYVYCIPAAKVLVSADAHACLSLGCMLKQSILKSHVLARLFTALDDNGNLTSPLGLQMAEFPLPPMFAKMLLVSGKSNGSYWEKTCLGVPDQVMIKQACSATETS